MQSVKPFLGQLMYHLQCQSEKILYSVLHLWISLSKYFMDISDDMSWHVVIFINLLGIVKTSPLLTPFYNLI